MSGRDPEAFFAQLEHVFADSNEQSKALEQVTNLRHHVGQLWHEHQLEFDGLLLSAGGDSWTDSAKIGYLKNSFSNPAKMYTVAIPKSNDYYVFSEEVEQIMTNLETTDQLKAANKRWSKEKNKDSVSYTTVTAKSQSPSIVTTVDADGDTVMAPARISGDRGKGQGERKGNSGKQRAKWVDAAEREVRREKKLFFRCGASGHRIKECPYAPAVQPTAINALPLLDDDNDVTDSVAYNTGKELTLARSQEPREDEKEALIKRWAEVKEVMNGNLIYTDVVLQNNTGTSALIDEGCQCYAAINGELARRLGLSLIGHDTRDVKGASSCMKSSNIEGVVAFRMGIDGFHQTVYAYVVPGLAFPLILGNPWKAHNKIRSAPEKRRYYHGRAERWVSEGRNHQRCQDDGNFTTVTASTPADIEKALKTKEHPTMEALKKKLPPEIGDMIPLFAIREAEKLAPHREGVDHSIEIRKQLDGTQCTLPWGPLYSMSKEELLVLRKSLDELLKKGYIRPFTSEAAAPVLFVRKPGGGLRFCCDYRALNAITKPDRYPLPLLPETLRMLTGARWLTKVDVVSAFH